MYFKNLILLRFKGTLLIISRRGKPWKVEVKCGTVKAFRMFTRQFRKNAFYCQARISIVDTFFMFLSASFLEVKIIKLDPT